ncbi:hypothetical protein JAAARDRAFT_127431, partial [Jaapia argillacea MUCL 33604]
LLQALLREVILWTNLSNPYILPCLGVSHLFLNHVTIVSPWLEHRDVLAYMRKTKLSSKEVDRLLEKVAQGLNYLHGEGVLHGDLRGANILIDNKLNPWLTDYGLAGLGESPKETVVWGGVRWMAPKVFAPQAWGRYFPYSRASDVYAYGCVCLELYTEAMPFHQFDESSVLEFVVRGDRPTQPTQDECKGRVLDAKLWTLVTRCWSQNIESRLCTEEVVVQMKRIVV